MVRIGGGSTKLVHSDRRIVYTKSRKQLLHRKYLLYETGCIWIDHPNNCHAFSILQLHLRNIYISEKVRA